MEKCYLWIDEQRCTAMLTEKDIEEIKLSLDGISAYEYLITLETGEQIDVGIIDYIEGGVK